MKIFIDTNILKFSAVKRHVFVPRETTVNWGGQDFSTIWHQRFTKNTIHKIRHKEQRNNAIFLPLLAKAGMLGHIKYFESAEVLFEAAGLPRMSSASGKFFGCPVERVLVPTDVSRVWLGGGRSADEWTDHYLNSIDDPRFVEICKATGAYQGADRPLHRNQARDALHIWTAEVAGADGLLTMDSKLASVVRRDPKKRIKIKIFSPREALGELLAALGLLGSMSFLIKSFRFAKRNVGFDEGEGWR